MSDEEIPHANGEQDRRQKAIENARDELRGLFSGLVIIGTWELEGGETATVSTFDGNWHAQNGAMSYCLNKRMAGAGLEAADQHRSDE